jgi:tRNA modification GTPase
MDAAGLIEATTIVAVATPAGRGGIGVVRLSGVGALAVAGRVMPWFAREARVAQYGLLREADGSRVDDAVATYFKGPASYTGEDVVEVAVHGSPVVLDWVVRACVAAGAVPARAGEFTERAFLRGRLDLTQAEAVRDLIDAQTLGQARLAAEQMGGSIAARVRPVKTALVELIAALEAGIDFAEDDVDTLPAPAIMLRVEALLPGLRTLLASFAHGRLLREGLRLAIVGRPNAGKSSLFNRLVERERAIVTATPGTTRDVIAERIALEGIPVELLDTAGLRETEDEAERMGVARSREAMAEADAVLLVVDGTVALEPDEGLVEALRGRPVVVALNKCDVAVADVAVPWVSVADVAVPWVSVRTSAVTGDGIEALRGALLGMVRGNASAGEATLTNLRQRDAVAAAVDALVRGCAAAGAAVPHEMVLLDLYEGLRALDELTGQTTPDDVLNLIFSSFCIGK